MIRSSIAALLLLLAASCSYSTRPFGELENVCTRVPLASGESCETCQDRNGNLASTSCPSSCGLCVNPKCSANERLVTVSGQCCPTCVPANDCGNSSCVIVNPLTCPSGQHAERDAIDCCREICVFDRCSGECPDEALDRCPAGYRLDPISPPCCSVCVPDNVGGCRDDSDCEAPATCSAGLCQRADGGVTCPAIDDPNPVECPGYWRIDPDTQGCPLPPTCICPDLYPAGSGTSCIDHCALTPIVCILDLFCDNGDTVTRNTCNPCCPKPDAVCSPPPRACVQDSDCGGQPVPGSVCIGGYCGARKSGLEGRAVTYNGETICLETECRPDQVVSFGSGCCPKCLDVCLGNQDCADGKSCVRDNLSTCAVQACHLPAGECGDSDKCYGVCQ